MNKDAPKGWKIYKLKDITTSDVSAFLTGLTCKPLTAKKIKIVFHSIMKYARTQKGSVFRTRIPRPNERHCS